MIFTQDQIEDMLNVVEFQHVAYIGENLGTDVLTKTDRALLQSFGIDVDKIKTKYPPIEEAFHFGRLASALGNYNTKGIEYKDFRKFLQRGGHVPLTRYESSVLESVKSRSYASIKGLGDGVKTDVSMIINGENNRRQNYEKIIRDAAVDKVKDRSSLKNMVSEIGHKTGDWDRRLDRIVETEMHNAYENGRAVQIEEKDGEDALVYFDVYPGACRHCIRLYLTAGIGSKPKVFKLSELRANGTNIGRKAKDYKPVIGGVHSFCRCTMNHLPKGYKWSDEAKMFTIDKDFVRASKVKTGNIKITIGTQEYNI